MRLIKIGEDRTGRAVFFPESASYNVVIVVAKPRYGKSVLVKNLYTQIADKRVVLIFDYQNEHSDSKFGNWRSKGKISFIPDLHTVSDFGFYMSDFEQWEDWLSMGFNPKSIPLFMELLGYSNIHKNNPAKLLEILRDLPTSKDDIEVFNQKYNDYGLYRQDTVHFTIKQSTITTFWGILQAGLIIPPMGTGEHTEICRQQKRYITHIENWGDYLTKYPHLNVNLNLVTSGSVMLARAGVGKILEQLIPYLNKLKPLIVGEEADFLVPNVPPNEENITSLSMFRAYVLKHQRTGVEVLFISQDPNLLDQFTLMGGTIWIMGQHTSSPASAAVLNEPDKDYVKDIIHKLRFDRIRNKREFAMMVSGMGGVYQIFEVDDAATFI